MVMMTARFSRWRRFVVSGPFVLMCSTFVSAQLLNHAFFFRSFFIFNALAEKANGMTDAQRRLVAERVALAFLDAVGVDDSDQESTTL